MIKCLDWRITSLCDNHCICCYGCKKIPSLNVKDEIIVLNKILKADIDAINITGGEPMLDFEKCIRMIDVFKRHKKAVYLSTNGLNCLKYIDFLSSSLDLLGLPLDGYDEYSNIVNGRNIDSFTRVISLIEHINLRKIPVKVKIGTVINKYNANETVLSKIYEVISKYECVKVWRLYEMIPVNFDGKYNKDIQADEKSILDVKGLTSQFNEISNGLNVEFASRLNRNCSYFMLQPDGSVVIPIDNNGRYNESIIGNLLTETFESVFIRWNQITKISEYMNIRLHDILGG